MNDSHSAYVRGDGRAQTRLAARTGGFVKTKAAATTLAALTLLGTTVLTGTPAGAAPTMASATQRGPTDQQIMNAFRDEWGQIAVEPTGITDWRTLSTWDRAAQYVFAPGTDETTGAPKQETDLAPLRVDVVTRQAHDKTEYQVRETAGNPDGTQILNYFPVFDGTPKAMTFYNAAGIPGLPAGEIQQACRDVAASGRHFLACRMISSDGAIRYQIKVKSGSPASGLPSIDMVMRAFQNQWGITTFAPTGATAWKPISQWERFKLFGFAEGDNEFTATPVDSDPATLRGLTVWMMTRTVNGERQFMERGLAVPEPGTTREDGFAFGRFSGGPTDWFINDDSLDPSFGGEYRQHRKVVTINGQELLVDRTLIPQADGSHSITYYVLRPSS